MNRWDQARQLLRIGRRVETDGEHRARTFRAETVDPERGPRPVRGRSLCVVSGKGGTGKSTITAALSDLLRREGRTLLVDADLGCANAHILHDVHPEHSFANVIAGERAVSEIVTPCGQGLDLLAGGSGIGRLAELEDYELDLIGRGLARIESDYDFTLVDSAAGLSRQTVTFAAACDRTLLVTTPDVTAMTDAYAFLKVFVRLCALHGERRPLPWLVVNRAASVGEASEVAARLQDVTRKFLGQQLEVLGSLPDDRAVFRCTQRRCSVSAGEPGSDLGRALARLGGELRDRLLAVDGAGVGARLSGMSRRPAEPRSA